MSPKDPPLSGMVSDGGPVSRSRSSADWLDMRPTFSLWHNPDWDSIVALNRWTAHRAVRWIRLFQLQDLVWRSGTGIVAFSPTGKPGSTCSPLAAI
jgi:hypothetical protein